MDLYVDVTKFALNIANGCVGCSLSLSEPHHLLWPLGFHPSAIEHERTMTELKRELGRLVVNTTAKVTGKVLTGDDQRRLQDEATRQLAS